MTDNPTGGICITRAERLHYRMLDEVRTALVARKGYTMSWSDFAYKERLPRLYTYVKSWQKGGTISCGPFTEIRKRLGMSSMDLRKDAVRIIEALRKSWTDEEIGQLIGIKNLPKRLSEYRTGAINMSLRRYCVIKSVEE